MPRSKIREKLQSRDSGWRSRRSSKAIKNIKKEIPRVAERQTRNAWTTDGVGCGVFGICGAGVCGGRGTVVAAIADIESHRGGFHVWRVFVECASGRRR